MIGFHKKKGISLPAERLSVSQERLCSMELVNHHQPHDRIAYKYYFVRFQVLTAGSMKMNVFWDVAPCSLIALMMKAASTSETSVNFHQITRRNISEDSHLHK
jgi:hypothetical protein